MPYSDQYQTFIDDKHTFFTGVNLAAQNVAEVVLNRARAHRYDFLATNKVLIEQEFNHLFDALDKKKGKLDNMFVRYCYYCCMMLEEYYNSRGEASKAEEYRESGNSLKVRIIVPPNVEDDDGDVDDDGSYIDGPALPPAPAGNDETFFQNLRQKIADSLKDIAATPTSLSNIENGIGWVNLLRIYWYFCRTTMTNSLLLARDLQWLEKLGKMLGKEIDPGSIITGWERYNHIFRGLSVGLFTIRLIINLGRVLQHTFYPHNREIELSWEQRFYNEIGENYTILLNDGVWSIANGLSNYNKVFNIPAPVAGWMVAVFLFFDVCLLLWRRHRDELKYLTKKSQYKVELLSYEQKNAQNEEQKKLFALHYEVLTGQLEQLEISWQTDNSTYLFNVFAALLLTMGFSASMLFTPTVWVLGSYMVCTLAVAMYLSGDPYKNYIGKGLILEQLELEEQQDQARAIANWEYEMARNDFIVAMTTHTIMPALFMTAVAVCWQAAVVLTLLYAGYGLCSSYNRFNQAKGMAQAEYTEAQVPAP